MDKALASVPRVANSNVLVGFDTFDDAGVYKLTPECALVQTVVPNGPADKAGVKGGNAAVSIGGQQIRAGGDLITAIDGKPVTGMDDVISAVNQKQPGDDVQLSLVHGSASRTVTVTLGNRPASAKP